MMCCGGTREVFVVDGVFGSETNVLDMKGDWRHGSVDAEDSARHNEGCKYLG